MWTQDYKSLWAAVMILCHPRWPKTGFLHSSLWPHIVSQTRGEFASLCIHLWSKFGDCRPETCGDDPQVSFYPMTYKPNKVHQDDLVFSEGWELTSRSVHATLQVLTSRQTHRQQFDQLIWVTQWAELIRNIQWHMPHDSATSISEVEISLLTCRLPIKAEHLYTVNDLTYSITLHSDWQVGGATQYVQCPIVWDLLKVLVIHV